MALRVAGWKQHYENNRTRELKTMKWIPVTTKQDGDGYTQIMDHPQGAAHYGAWIAILQVAAKCPERGVLEFEKSNGAREPYTPESLSRRIRVPAAILATAIKRLLDIGWLEEDGNQAEPTLAVSTAAQEIAGSPREGAKKEREQIFDRFWSAYPRKVGKLAARKAWLSLSDDLPDIEDLLAAIERSKRSSQWSRDGGQFIPHPATWLRQGRWDDVDVEGGATYRGSGKAPSHPVSEATKAVLARLSGKESAA